MVIVVIFCDLKRSRLDINVVSVGYRGYPLWVKRTRHGIDVVTAGYLGYHLWFKEN